MATEVEDDDPLAALRGESGTLPAYAERAYALYEAATFYMSELVRTRDPVATAAHTCELYGHDAPRGLCLRCGLGHDVDKGKDAREETQERVAKREAWLRSRGG